jgi:hypothetical protein
LATVSIVVLTSGGTVPPIDVGSLTAPFGINCGGPDYESVPLGITMLADFGYTGGTAGTTTNSIAGYEPYGLTLLQSERWGTHTRSYVVNNDTYLVTLLFAETYFTSVGQRVFDVAIEGATVLNDYDIISGVGPNAVAAHSFVVTVADGAMSFAFTSVTEDAEIRAIIVEEYSATVPDAIADLAAFAGDGQVDFTFTPAPNSTQTNLYWDTTSTVTTADTKVADIQSGYSLTGLTNGVQIWAKVEAENAAGVSALSNLVTATPAAAPTTGIQLYVATTGSDAAAGTSGDPFLTPGRFFQEVRTLTGRTITGGPPPLGWQGATMHIAAGTYPLTSTLLLDSRDSGTELHPVVIDPTGTVIITGAVLVSDGAWTQVTGGSDSYANARLASPAATYYITLASLGITTSAMNGGYAINEATPMPIDDGAIVRLSRYPSGAETSAGSWLTITAAVDGGYGAAATVDVSDNTINGWNTIATQNAMCYGMWDQPWTQYWERVNAIATVSGSTRRISLPSREGAYSITNNPINITKFIAFRNILEGTTAGTYTYCPTQTGRLYYRNAAGTAPSSVSITNLSTLIKLGVAGNQNSSANWITFEDLIFEGTRSRVIEAQYCDGVRMDGCTIRNFGGDGIRWDDMADSGLVDCTIQDGAWMQGTLHGRGKSTLTDSGCYVTNLTATRCGFMAHFDNFGALLLSRYNRHASNASGCGVTITGGQWSDLPLTAISINSALVTIDGADFDSVCQVFGDAAAIYGGRRHSNRGKAVRNCTFSNIVRHPLQNIAYGNIFGVYMDDSEADCIIEDNVFTTCDNAIYHASGKDIVTRRNKFTACSSGHHTAPIYLGSRIGKEGSMGVEIQTDLKTLPLGTAPWSTTYPWLLNEIANGEQASDGSVSNGTLASSIMTPRRTSPTTVYAEIDDNMATDGTYLVRVATDVVTYHDLTQLNYPVGSSGTPILGGGSAALSTMDRN